MDTSLDNANNPFSNSNGSDNNIIGQKSEGLLLNLSENFKHNGADLSPTGDFYHNNEKSNGKRLASEFDDDDDLGPETDVDAVDDIVSPSIAAAKALAEGIVNNNPDGSFNPFVEKNEVEKATLEIDLDIQKQQSSMFDGRRSPREETPTPPADTVHDAGLEENIGESGEESEDEWNYIKGEEANKENISPSQADCEVAELLEDQENMSQLNPNAAEFVPVSPTRSNPSPACRLVNDPWIAQSPKRPSEIDINLPNPQEFENEVKSRPSDATFSNGHDQEGDQKSSTQELMEHLLNGKNIDEIPEFQPGNTPSKTGQGDEFHFGPNAAPFTPIKLLDQSESCLSTKAVYGDESIVNTDTTLDTSLDNVDFTAKLKEDDPMSMSFYQDKGIDDLDPFDLNKVQVIPDNLDEFLSKPDERNIPQEDTISDLPEHNPVGDTVADEIILNNDERIQTTDLDKVDDEKELASPVSNDDESSGVCELSRSPQPQTEDLQCNLVNNTLPDVCLRPDSKSPQPLSQLKMATSEQELVSPESEAASPACQALSPELLQPYTLSPEPTADSSNPQIVTPQEAIQDSEVCLLNSELQAPALSPEPFAPAFSPERSAPEPETTSPIVCHRGTEVFCEIQKPLILEAVSPEPIICHLPKKIETPEPEKLIETVPTAEDLCNFESYDQKESVESPVEDITSSVKDVSSPITSPLPDQIALDTNVQLSFAQEINSAVQSTVTIESSSPIREDNLVPEICPLSTPKSVTDTESVATADVNSFLERSPIAELASPLSPGEPILSANDTLSTCVYPTEIETENIIPEFAEPVVLSPIDTKEETPSIPSAQEETTKESEVVNKELLSAAATAVAAGAAAMAVAATTAEKKPTKAKTPTTAKKPAPKSSVSPATKPTTSPTKAKVALAAAKLKPMTAKSTPTASRPTSTTTSKPAISKLAPKPKTLTTATTTKTSTERKPLSNGDVKTSVKANLTARKSSESSKPATSKPTIPVNKASPTKPLAARPATAPAKTISRFTATHTSTLNKPRPPVLTSKTTTNSTGTKTMTSTTATSRTATSRTITSTTSPKTASPPKPRPTTAPGKPKVPATKTVTKTSADTEKQIKDSTNKLTASRTLTNTRTTASTATKTTTSIRKTESKVPGATRTTVTKTTTTTTRPGATKKPLEITRAGSKSKTATTKIEKPIQNGVTAVVTEQITIVNNGMSESDTQLLKDNSPIDNKLLVDTNAAD